MIMVFRYLKDVSTKEGRHSFINRDKGYNYGRNHGMKLSKERVRPNINGVLPSNGFMKLLDIF